VRPKSVPTAAAPLEAGKSQAISIVYEFAVLF
jgi:hypothetical protein